MTRRGKTGVVVPKALDRYEIHPRFHLFSCSLSHPDELCDLSLRMTTRLQHNREWARAVSQADGDRDVVLTYSPGDLDARISGGWDSEQSRLRISQRRREEREPHLSGCLRACNLEAFGAPVNLRPLLSSHASVTLPT